MISRRCFRHFESDASGGSSLARTAGKISVNFALEHPEMTQELVLVGAVVGGMPYSKHFLDRGEVLGKPLEKGDVQEQSAAATNTNT